MEDLMKRFFLAALMLLCLFMLTGIGYGQSGDRRGGDLRYGEDELAGSLNPYDANAVSTSDRLFALIYEPLVRYDVDKDDFIYVLAETSKTSPDGKKLTFMLRTTPRWHDDKPFTAADVKFTYEYIRSKQKYARKYQHITAILEEGPSAISFIFAASQSDPRDFFTRWIIPKHRFGAHMEDLQPEPLKKYPIGTGPYLFGNMTIDGEINLQLNDRYWGKTANILNLVMKPQPDPQSKVMALTYDGIQLATEIKPNYLAQVAQDKKFFTRPYSSFSFDAFAYNCRNPLLSEAVVRRAMTMALNRKSLLDNFYFGKGQELAGPVIDSSPFYNAELRPLPYNPEKAKAMLDSVGFRDQDGDGIRERITDKAKLRFGLIVPVEKEAQSTETGQVANAFKEAMARIGIAIELEHLNRDVYDKRQFVEHKFDIIWVRWEFDTGYNVRELFDANEDFVNGKNFIGYRNPSIQELINKFTHAPDPVYKRDLMMAFQEVLRDECPYTFLYSINATAAWTRRLIVTSIDPYYFFTFIPDWYFPVTSRARTRMMD